MPLGVLQETTRHIMMVDVDGANFHDGLDPSFLIVFLMISLTLPSP